jgi:hypothetical protein
MNEEERRQIDRELRAMMDRQNNQPDPSREGLSPKQIHRLLWYPLTEQSWLGFRPNLSKETLLRMPVIRGLFALLEHLDAEGEVKLTKKGNLPRKLVQELYVVAGSPFLSFDAKLPASEDDWFTLGDIHFGVCNLRWCKKRKGKLSLTAQGRKALAGPPQELCEAFIRFHLFELTMGAVDGYAYSDGLQSLLPYSIFLLHKYGETPMDEEAYGRKVLEAFPLLHQEFTSNAYRSAEELFVAIHTLRIFDRCFKLYNWATASDRQHFDEPRNWVATDLFYELFEVRSLEDLPTSGEHADKEIEMALFDAEMGGISHFSEELPLEVMKAFHDQVRAVHAQGSPDEVEIRSLLPTGFYLLPAEEVVEEPIADREVSRVLEALKAAKIVTEQPDHLSAVDYYAFLHDTILPSEIFSVGDGMTIFLPFEDFLEEELDDRLEPEIIIAEAFLLSLFMLNEPFFSEFLAQEVRLGDEMVKREAALEHINAWRAQYQEIVPMSFGPGPIEEDGSGCFFPTFQVAYKTVTVEGKEEIFDGVGLVQLVASDENLLVQGAQFPGFEF